MVQATLVANFKIQDSRYWILFLSRYKRQQADDSGSFDGFGNHPLVLGANPGSLAGQKFANGVDVLSKQDYIFVIHHINFVGTKITRFAIVTIAIAIVTIIIHTNKVKIKKNNP